MREHGDGKVRCIDPEGVGEPVLGQEADRPPELEAEQQDSHIEQRLPATMAVVLRAPFGIRQILLQVTQPASMA